MCCFVKLHKRQWRRLCSLHIILRILFGFWLKSILGSIDSTYILSYTKGTIENGKDVSDMKKLVDKAMEDLSTREVFLFRIACRCCGREYRSRPRVFSKAGVQAPTQERQILLDAVYDLERMPSRQKAALEIAEHFNYCPVCKQIVCNYCFLISSDLDLCKSCAEALQEIGSPVFTEVLDYVV